MFMSISLTFFHTRNGFTGKTYPRDSFRITEQIKVILLRTGVVSIEYFILFIVENMGQRMRKSNPVQLAAIVSVNLQYVSFSGSIARKQTNKPIAHTDNIVITGRHRIFRTGYHASGQQIRPQEFEDFDSIGLHIGFNKMTAIRCKKIVVLQILIFLRIAL